MMLVSLTLIATNTPKASLTNVVWIDRRLIIYVANTFCINHFSSTTSSTTLITFIYNFIVSILI